MSEVTLRPRYKFDSKLSSEEIRTRLKAALKDEEKNKLGLQHRSVSGHVIVVFPKEHKHFWSPTLDVSMEKKNEDQTLVRVLMGPEPSIWTLFMFFYTLGGLTILAGFILGFSQYMLKGEYGMLALIPLGTIIVLFFYFAAVAGRAKAQDQMYQLDAFLQKAVNSEPQA